MLTCRLGSSLQLSFLFACSMSFPVRDYHTYVQCEVQALLLYSDMLQVHVYVYEAYIILCAWVRITSFLLLARINIWRCSNDLPNCQIYFLANFSRYTVCCSDNDDNYELLLMSQVHVLIIATVNSNLVTYL